MSKNLKFLIAFVLSFGLLFLLAAVPKVNAETVATENEEEKEVAEEAEEAEVKIDHEQGTITVSGRGRVKLEATYASLSLAVETFAETAAEASEANSELMNKLFETFEAMGIAKEDMFTDYFSIWPERNYYNEEGGPPSIVGYRVNNEIMVNIRDLEKVGEVVVLALEAGANNVNNIQFNVDETTEAYDRALVLAIERAGEKAAIMAKAFGVTLDPMPLEINEYSSEQPSYMYHGNMMDYDAKAEASAGGAPPFASRDIEVTASVNVVYKFK